MKRPAQPAELASAFVMLADPISSYVSGATIAVTGGKPVFLIAAIRGETWEGQAVAREKKLAKEGKTEDD